MKSIEDMREDGLTPLERRVVAVVDNLDGACTIGDVCRSLGERRGVVIELLEGLAQRGIIELDGIVVKLKGSRR
jgi:hypothetical protein